MRTTTGPSIHRNNIHFIMNTDASVQSILNGFLALNDSQSRRAVYQGIFQALTPREMHEISSYIKEFTFQRDIFGQLPMEIACLVAQYFDLGDIFVHRRVSKRWRELLSCSTVLQSKMRTIPRKYSTLSLCKSVSGLESILKRRWRMEHGRPAALVELESCFDFESNSVRCFSYCDGMLAWLSNTEHDFLYLLFLRTGQLKRYTTENRELLEVVQVSADLVTAVSIRGHCHVWNVRTDQHKSFRLSSTNFLRVMVNGVNVVFHYRNQIIHFSFLSGLAHTAIFQDHILTMSLHASESQISMICIQKKDGQHVPHGKLDHREWEGYQLQVQRISLQGDRLQSVSLQHHDLSSLISLPKGWDIRFEERILFRAGQSSFTTIEMSTEAREGDVEPHETVYFSLDIDDTVAAHSITWFGWCFLPPCYLDQELVYGQRIPNSHELYIGFEQQMVSTVPAGAVKYHLDLASCPRKVMVAEWEQHMMYPLEMQGDDEFVICSQHDQTFLWTFDEAWKPPTTPRKPPISLITNL